MELTPPAERDYFIVVDVETAGPNPGQYSLLTIGACTPGERPNTFYVEIKPVNERITPEAYAVHHLDLKRLAERGLSPTEAMTSFENWLKTTTPEGRKPVFVAYNAPFNWMFINEYFQRFLGRNPFGHSSLDVKSMFAGLTGSSWQEISLNSVRQRYLGGREVTHHSLRDALDLAEIFTKMLEEVHIQAGRQALVRDAFLEQVLNLPSVEGAQLSPDGRWVVFMWYRVQENMDVFLVACDGSSPPLALTNTSQYTRLVGWMADSQAVVVAEDHDGDERDRLFRIDLNLDANGKPHPGIMQPLTEDHPPYFLRGGSLSPDGRILFYGANYDFESQQPLEMTWIYRHDLKTGKRTPIVQPEKPAYTAPQLNLTGTHLIYGRKDRHPSGYQIHLVDVHGKKDEEILNLGDQVKVFASWLPDGKNILAVAERESAEGQLYKAVGVYRWSSQELRWLVDDPGRSIQGAWASPDGLVIVDEVVQASHRPSVIDPRSGEEYFFPPSAGNLLPLGKATDGNWVAKFYSSIAPRELVRTAWDGQSEKTLELQSLTQVWKRTVLRPGQLTKAESFRWKSDDGLEIQGWLYRARPNLRRAVIAVHGGPTWHAEDEIKPALQYLAAQGFNVLDVNYRGSTGFGMAFQEAIKVDGWGGREQQDIAAGSQALMRAGLADPGRVGVYGVSYGGYSSWFLITHYPPGVFAAAAPICGMTDLVIDYETTRPDLRPYSEEMIGGSPTEVPERYYERSPIHFVQNIKGNILIVQGALDPNVTPENMRQVMTRLNEHGIVYDTLVFEDEGHGVVKLKNQDTLYRKLGDFFTAALG